MVRRVAIALVGTIAGACGSFGAITPDDAAKDTRDSGGTRPDASPSDASSSGAPASDGDVVERTDAGLDCSVVKELDPSVHMTAIDSAKSKITVDGQIGDWPCSSFRHLTAGNAEKKRGEVQRMEGFFAVAWAPNGFYFGVLVEDDRPLELAGDAITYNADAVELYFSSEPTNDGQWDNGKRVHAIVDWSGHTQLFSPTGTKTLGSDLVTKVGLRGDRSFFVEGFVPVSYVGVTNLAKGTPYGFDVQLDDRFEGKPQNGVLWAYDKGALSGGEGNCGTADREPACDSGLWSFVDLE
ncbi:MAG: sugar-binding protein [Labilithrix sp.]